MALVATGPVLSLLIANQAASLMQSQDDLMQHGTKLDRLVLAFVAATGCCCVLIPLVVLLPIGVAADIDDTAAGVLTYAQP